MTLTELKNEITNAGGTVLDAACYENGIQIFASSVETQPGCCGHPKFEAQFMKETGWVRLMFGNSYKEFRINQAMPV